MAQPAIHEGMLVLHPSLPQWGPGKVVKVDHESVHVFWRDLTERRLRRLMKSAVSLEMCPTQTDPILDNLPPMLDPGGMIVEQKAHVTLEQARAKFKARFPGGFYDPKYIGVGTNGERCFRDKAKDECTERLGNGRMRGLLGDEPDLLVKELQRCYRAVKLLSPYEKAAWTDALREPRAVTEYLTCLTDVLEQGSVDQGLWTRYLRSVSNLPQDRGRVATWPVATLLPSLMWPSDHMFLKPSVTQEAAEALGFNLNYKAEPNWLTYERLLRMGQVYMDLLADMKPRDLADVQAFFWVACGGYE